MSKFKGIPYPLTFKLTDEKYTKLFGTSSKAKNFVLIFYRDWVHPSVIEQEKAEALLTLSFFALAGLVWFLTAWYFALLPLIVYPLPYLWHYPGSHHVRGFVEIRTHALEIRAWAQAENPTDLEVEQKLRKEAVNMFLHEPYDLRLHFDAIYERLLHHVIK